jgi:hypothetical protein
MRSAKLVCLAMFLGALSACNSTDLGVQSTTSQPASVATPTPPATTPAAPAGLLQNIALNTVKLRVAPIIGAPVSNVTPLSRRISARSKESAITLVSLTDPAATHVLKGYFSALNEGSSVTIIYVFDVLDPAGNRLHRIQGQETVPASNVADPWAAVPPATMESIADKAMQGFSGWVTGSA